MENARIVSDNACFGFDRAFCLTDFTSCQYVTAACNEEKFDKGPPDSDKFVQIQQKRKYGFFTKTRFSRKKLVFFPLGLQLIGSLKLRIYIYTYIHNIKITYRRKHDMAIQLFPVVVHLDGQEQPWSEGRGAPRDERQPPLVHCLLTESQGDLTNKTGDPPYGYRLVI